MVNTDFDAAFAIFVDELEDRYKPYSDEQWRLMKQVAFEVYTCAKEANVDPTLALSIAIQESTLGLTDARNILQLKNKLAFEQVKDIFKGRYDSYADFIANATRVDYIRAGLAYLKSLTKSVATLQAKKHVLQQLHIGQGSDKYWKALTTYTTKFHQELLQTLAEGRTTDDNGIKLLLGAYNEGIGEIQNRYLTIDNIDKALDFVSNSSTDNKTPLAYFTEIATRGQVAKAKLDKRNIRM